MKNWMKIVLASKSLPPFATTKKIWCKLFATFFVRRIIFFFFFLSFFWHKLKEPSIAEEVKYKVSPRGPPDQPDQGHMTKGPRTN